MIEFAASSGYTKLSKISTGSFASPLGIATGVGGNAFVADKGHNAIKEILLVQPAAILPSSRCVQVGAPATVFASMVNGGQTNLANCTPQLPGTAPAGLTLDYRPPEAATNTVIGALDQPVPIAAGASQSFVLGFNAAAARAAPGRPIVFLCDNAAAPSSLPDVDTVDLQYSATPVADIIALAATATPDLTMYLAANNGAFAVATANAGAASALTITTDTGSATLPLTTTICQTIGRGVQTDPL